MVAVFAFILPVVLLVPKELVATADREPNPGLDAELMSEIGGAAASGTLARFMPPATRLLESASRRAKFFGVKCHLMASPDGI